MWRRLFRRWSFWVLAFMILVACVCGFFYPHPEDEVAPPFSKPMWVDGSLAPSSLLEVDGTSPLKSLDWRWSAPARIMGRVLIADAEEGDDGGFRLVWRSPVRDFVLFDSGTFDGEEFGFDSRDLMFKRRMGVSPFGDLSSEFFPSDGRYELLIVDPEGELGYGAGFEASFFVEGGRWGLLGTDHRGRDIWALFVVGIRVSLIVGISATLIATLLGLSFGLLAGYVGGLVDAFIMRVVDVLLSIPTLPILMVLASVWGKGLWQLVLILSVFSWMGTARTIRAHTLTLRDASFVEGLRGIGAPTSFIIFRHLVPEILPLLLANIALGVPGAVLSEAGIAFLGLSDPRVISWGRILHEAHVFGAFTSKAWWMLLPPGLGIAAICLVFMDLGKYLEELSDPRLGKS